MRISEGERNHQIRRYKKEIQDRVVREMMDGANGEQHFLDTKYGMKIEGEKNVAAEEQAVVARQTRWRPFSGATWLIAHWLVEAEMFVSKRSLHRKEHKLKLNVI